MAAVNDVVAQLKASVERLMAEGRAEGIEPDGPLGRWLEAQAQSLSTLAEILGGQSKKIDDTLSRISGIATEETERLRAAIAAAKETTSRLTGRCSLRGTSSSARSPNRRMSRSG